MAAGSVAGPLAFARSVTYAAEGLRAAGKDGEGKGTWRARGGGWAWGWESGLEEGPWEAGPSREGLRKTAGTRAAKAGGWRGGWVTKRGCRSREARGLGVQVQRWKGAAATADAGEVVAWGWEVWIKRCGSTWGETGSERACNNRL